MNQFAKYLLAGLGLAALPLISGCVVHAHPEPVVYDDYYYHGYYDGPNYYWHDRDGHLMHEDRAIHERREHDEHREHAEEHHP